MVVLQALGDESVWQVEHEGLARFHSQVWVQPLDGKSEFTEYVCSHHALADENAMARRRMLTRISPVSEGIGVVDLSGGHSWGSSLCIGGFHDNARPRIHQDDYPLLDDEKGAHKIVGLTPECEPTRIPLASIFPVINDVAVQDEKGERLADAVSYANAYCARLFGEYRNCDRTLNELVVLSPDDWNAVTQEFVIRSFHMLERRRVHLLWRSVATAIGLDEYVQPHVSENDIVAVLDVRNDGKVLVTGLKYLKDAESGRLVPQRSVYLRNGRINEGRYGLLPCSDWERVLLYPIVRDAKVICVSGQIPVSLRRFLRVSCRFEPFVSSDSINIGRASYGASRWTVISDGDFGWSQRDGAVSFCRQHDKRTLYFDELEPMWVVGQDEIHEKVVCEALVAAEERFPGGTSRRIPIDCGRLNIGEGQRGVKFLFHIGAITNTTALHEYKQDLMGDFVQQRQPLDVEVEVSPGQGMAITTVMAPIFKQPIVLDYLNNMVLSQETIAKMDDKLERSFPPTSAVVEAIQESVIDSFWGSSETDVERQIKAFIAGRMKFSQIPSEPCLFYRARRKREADLRFGESKLHLLDRYNIFGNVPGALRPKWMSEDDENTLFAKVVAGLRDDCPKALRLIAWTYRGGYKDFEGITRKVFARWKRRESPGYAGGMVVWRSLMANLLPCKELRDLLPLFVEEFTKRGIRGEWNCDDLRLFYNLLQFDEDFSVHACLTCDEASSIALALTKCLTSYRESRSTNSYDAALRSMLYLFRLREKERHFLRDYSSYAGKVPVKDSTRQRMERTFERLNVELDRHMSDERPATTLLRKITKKFLNGSGTLPDVLSILGDK